MRRAISTESQEQIAIFTWAALMSAVKPELKMLYAVPNGGHRNIITACRMKREGVRRGVPDMCLPIPRGSWHGLYIELKTASGRVSDDQTAWLNALRGYGYCAQVCYGFDEAKRVITTYLEWKS